jgi:hypothetical protein
MAGDSIETNATVKSSASLRLRFFGQTVYVDNWSSPSDVTAWTGTGCAQSKHATDFLVDLIGADAPRRQRRSGERFRPSARIIRTLFTEESRQ